MNLTIPDILFVLFAVVSLLCGVIVVYSRNIVHSGFALLGTFAGVAGLYGLLSMTFLAAAQILVYVGGVLIVILFAIMLTRGIENTGQSNPSRGVLPATILGVIAAALLIYVAVTFPWQVKTPAEIEASVPPLGNALLGAYVVPFEALSLLLLAALVGAVMLVRKEIKSDEEEVKS
ncbi:MAG TPA: NADH-quinone oxidoreductase subunit J [bacterium]|nr:NADH-quinone oxidoreductase subunit J [bacterium]